MDIEESYIHSKYFKLPMSNLSFLFIASGLPSRIISIHCTEK